ncbi:hypothetical protein LY76DRAFT_602035 [Colletotrichum caudatum]|nr:hypothetical protein LY76DRAFT_602035 [Colletotrichum caudatum]
MRLVHVLTIATMVVGALTMGAQRIYPSIVPELASICPRYGYVEVEAEAAMANIQDKLEKLYSMAETFKAEAEAAMQKSSMELLKIHDDVKKVVTKLNDPDITHIPHEAFGKLSALVESLSTQHLDPTNHPRKRSVDEINTKHDETTNPQLISLLERVAIAQEKAAKAQEKASAPGGMPNRWIFDLVVGVINLVITTSNFFQKRIMRTWKSIARLMAWNDTDSDVSTLKDKVRALEDKVQNHMVGDIRQELDDAKATVQRLENSATALNARATVLEDTITTHDIPSIKSNLGIVSKKATSIDDHLNAYDIPGIKKNINSVVAKTKDLETKTEDLETHLNDYDIPGIKNNLNSVVDKTKDLETKTKDLETKTKDLETKTKDLETKTKDLENKTQAVETSV